MRVDPLPPLALRLAVAPAPLLLPRRRSRRRQRWALLLSVLRHHHHLSRSPLDNPRIERTTSPARRLPTVIKKLAILRIGSGSVVAASRGGGFKTAEAGRRSSRRGTPGVVDHDMLGAELGPRADTMCARFPFVRGWPAGVSAGARDDGCFGAWRAVETRASGWPEPKRSELSGVGQRQGRLPARRVVGTWERATRRLWLIPALLCVSLWGWEGWVRIPAGLAFPRSLGT